RRPAPRPRVVSEELPGTARESVALPQEASLPMTERVRVASADVHEPLPLPVLATPVIDRASLDDATGEASATAALAVILPPRTSPAPFLRLTVPDPYELRRPLTLVPSTDKAEPVASTPQTPKP